MAAELDNIIRLCFRCHFHWWHKNPLEAGDWFDEKWPGRKERLYENARNNPKRDWQTKYEELRDETRQAS